MPVERIAGGTSFLDVLDRVLDKGIIIDAWIRASLGGVGIDLITVETCVIVVSIATYLRTSDELAQASRTLGIPIPSSLPVRADTAIQ